LDDLPGGNCQQTISQTVQVLKMPQEIPEKLSPKHPKGMLICLKEI